MSASLPGLELVLLVTLVAAVAQVASGFGFAVVATPFLAALLGTTGGIQLAIIVTGVLSAVMGWRLRHALDLPLLRRLLPACLPGLAIGYLGYLALDPLAVRMAMGHPHPDLCALAPSRGSSGPAFGEPGVACGVGARLLGWIRGRGGDDIDRHAWAGTC